MALRAKFLPSTRLRLFLALIVLLVGALIITFTYERIVEQAMTLIISWKHTRKQSLGANIPRPLDDVLLAEPKPRPGRSIFFLETSRIKRPKPEMIHNMLQLTARQACAIESAALHNPSFQVFVLFAGPTYHYNENSSQGQQSSIAAIRSYKNVELRQLNIRRYVTGTPIEEWVKYGYLFSSRYLINHISDLLRFISLYRFGGIYLDMDVVVLRSMENIPLNYAGVESDSHVASGVMSMGPTGFGHEVAESCLRDFQQHFDGNAWGNNGPGVITRVVQKICGTKNVSLMIEDNKRCLGFKVFERKAFYAVPWEDWEHFFEPKFLNPTLERTKNSYLIHMWNDVSNKLTLKVGSGTAYGKYAEQHCPRAYAAAGEYF